MEIRNTWETIWTTGRRSANAREFTSRKRPEPRIRVRNFGDRLTGGCLRALFKRVRQTGDRLTGGGVRRLSKRIATKSLQAAMRQPLLSPWAAGAATFPYPFGQRVTARHSTGYHGHDSRHCRHNNRRTTDKNPIVS